MSAVQGVLEVHGGLVTLLLRYAVPMKGGCRAMTLGHVVLGRDPASLRQCRAHERIHVRQYEMFGPFLIPAYLLSSLVLLLLGKDPYHQNPFEKHAESKAPDETGFP